jgi:hypothetical protein
MEIDGLITEEMPGGILRFYMSDRKRKKAAVGNIGGFVFGLIWMGGVGFMIVTALHTVTLPGQPGYTFLIMPAIFFLIGALIAYFSLMGFLTDLYGSIIWYASSNSLIREVSLWGHTRRKTVTSCCFRMDRVHDKYGGYLHTCLVAQGAKVTQSAMIDESRDEDQLRQLAEVVGRYTGWALNDIPGRNF